MTLISTITSKLINIIKLSGYLLVTRLTCRPPPPSGPTPSSGSSPRATWPSASVRGSAILLLLLLLLLIVVCMYDDGGGGDDDDYYYE